MQFRLDLIRPNSAPIEIGVWDPPDSLFSGDEKPELGYIGIADVNYMPGIVEPIRFRVTRIH